MKPLRLLSLLLLLLVAFGEPPVLPDTSLDGLWFKVNIKAKGRAILEDGSDIFKGSLTMPGFLQVVLNEAAGTGNGAPPTTAYALDLWTETSPDTFTLATSANVDVVVSTGTDYIAPDAVLFPSVEDTALSLRATLLLHVKRDKDGNVTGGKVSTLGCEVFFGTQPGLFLYGGAKLTGKAVDEADLPFTP